MISAARAFQPISLMTQVCIRALNATATIAVNRVKAEAESNLTTKSKSANSAQGGRKGKKHATKRKT